MTDQRKGLNGRMKFLLMTLTLYGLLALVVPDVITNALHYFVMMLTKVIPILGLVFVILLLSNIFIKPSHIKKHLGKDSGLRGWLYAIIGGILISGPPYILYPMLRELQKHGARNGLLAAMLYNRNVKIHFLPALVYYFGLHFTLILSGYIIIFSLLSGKLLEIFVKDGEGPGGNEQKEISG